MNNSTKSAASVASGSGDSAAAAAAAPAPAAEAEAETDTPTIPRWAQGVSHIAGLPVSIFMTYCFDGTDLEKERSFAAALEEVRNLELRDEQLFKQPESSHLGDCPICLLPIPIITTQDIMRYYTYTCCCKIVCDGCLCANRMRERRIKIPHACPFCRHPVSETDEENDVSLMGRIKVDDPLALHDAAQKRYRAGDFATAAEYWGKAAGLSHIDSHYKLGILYQQGRGVEGDMNKAIHHLEEAAIGGHPNARHNLGELEDLRGNTYKAAKHFIIAANLGFDGSLKTLRKYYQEGKVSKEDFAAALRAYQDAVEAAKSPQRAAAAEE